MRAGLSMKDLQQIVEPVMSVHFRRQPRRGEQGALREDIAVGGAVGQLDALAHAGELHGVLADDVAAAQRMVDRRLAAGGLGGARRVVDA